jgi:hypothetical protein
VVGLRAQLMVGGRLVGRGITRISAVHVVVPPRPSFTRAVTMYEPAASPAEFHRTCGPVPSTVPPVAVQVYVSVSLSGSVAFTRVEALSPGYTVVGLAKQDADGGRL